MPKFGYPDTTPLYMFIHNCRASYRYVRACKVAKQAGERVVTDATIMLPISPGLIRLVAATAPKLLLLLLPIVCTHRLCLGLPGLGRGILRISGHLLINLISGIRNFVIRGATITLIQELVRESR